MTRYKAYKAATLIEQVFGIRVPGQKYPRRVIKARTEISKHYSELKRTFDFTTSASIARRTWLANYLVELGE